MSEGLATREAVRLVELETTIERGLRGSVEAIKALREIRDAHLYRARYGTFEDYCQARWGFTSNYARRLMHGAEVVQMLDVETVPIGTVLPATESQARPLTALPPDEQREAWQRAIETAPDGKLTAAHVQSVVDEMSGKLVHGSLGDFYRLANDVKKCAVCGELWGADLDYCPYCHIPREKRVEYVQNERKSAARQDVAVTIFSSESNEYYTPSQYIEAAREVMGGIDLDPASCEAAQRMIQAIQFYTESDDGFNKPWIGRVWLNPPYGKIGSDSSQGQWAHRMIAEYEAGRVTEGIVLVKAAVGYEWFELLWDRLPVCFARDRVSFIRADGSSDGQSKQGTAFFYVGPDPTRFIEVFRQFGRVILPEAQL